VKLISDEYRKLNEQLHKRRAYGIGGARWADEVRRLHAEHGCTTVLDYGCGKGALKRALMGEITVAEFDPAIPEKHALPHVADLVVCTDVLEHIEPDCLDAVLTHLRLLTRKVALLSIATRPSTKTLADGRNAHLIVEDAAWWIVRLDPYFEIVDGGETVDQLTLTATPR
jgi:hypothetical protein